MISEEDAKREAVMRGFLSHCPLSRTYVHDWIFVQRCGDGRDWYLHRKSWLWLVVPEDGKHDPSNSSEDNIITFPGGQPWKDTG
jgi:hypothetical protein